jgi:hypothetical protein
MEVIVEKIDSKRMAVSRDYLNDARHEELSPSTRLKCAWEAMYFCACEYSASKGSRIDSLEHPDANVVEQLLRALSLSADERILVEVIFHWSSYLEPLSPEPCSAEEACSLAEQVHIQTVALLAAMKTSKK